jgi:hypothetical protein
MTGAVAEPTAVTASALGIAADLLLARLLVPRKTPPRLSEIRTGLERFFRHPPTVERWQETVEGLAGAGLLTVRPFCLTDAGRARALEFLGISELPQKYKWPTIEAKYLVPMALGLPPTARDARKRIEKAEGLAALLLKRSFELALGASPTLGRVVEALVCREVGFPGETSLAAVKAEVLSRLMDSDERLKPKELSSKLPRVLLKAKRGGVAGLRDVVLRGWADGVATHAESPAPSPVTAASELPRTEPVSAEFDLPAFAETVKAAARGCPTGRFGDNKVFINHLWRRLRDESPFRSMDLPTFKQRLTEANTGGLLQLTRADLVEVMHPVDVDESKTPYLNTSFHFVVVGKEQA